MSSLHGFEDSSDYSVPWHVLKNLVLDFWLDHSKVLGGVVIRTSSSFSALYSLSARLGFIVHWVVFKLFPTVTKLAVITIWTSIFIFEHELVGIPVGTRLRLVGMNFASIVLKVMRIHTH